MRRDCGPRIYGRSLSSEYSVSADAILCDGLSKIDNLQAYFELLSSLSLVHSLAGQAVTPYLALILIEFLSFINDFVASNGELRTLQIICPPEPNIVPSCTASLAKHPALVGMS